VTRRPGVLVSLAVGGLATTLALAACSPGGSGQTPPPTGTTSSAPSAPAGTETPGDGSTTEPPGGEPAPSLDAAPAWAPEDGEVKPEVKLAATSFLQTAGTWTEAGGGRADQVADRLTGDGFTPEAAGTAVPVADPTAVAASLAVVYPQYGGLTEDRSSVMTAVRQELVDPDGGTRTRELTLDVRLSLTDGTWQVTGVVPTEPPLAGDGQLSAAAQAVLDNANVRLPGAAEADLRTGALDDTMLTILDGLAQEHVIDVLTFYDGHPENVFETDRTSNHHHGRAVDIWAIDDRQVVTLREDRAFLDPIKRRAAELGATEVGGPYDLNGPKPGFFTDAVHQDHLHVGVSVGRPPAQP